MTTRKKAAATKTRGAVAGVAGQLAALHEMTVADLRERYREVFGEPSRSRNKVWLRKKVAWRIQELAEGGLSDDARRRIQELGPGAPVRWRASNGGTPKEARAPDTRPRDPALPPPGTVLTRLYRGAEHHVTVLEEGFEYVGGAPPEPVEGRLRDHRNAVERLPLLPPQEPDAQSQRGGRSMSETPFFKTRMGHTFYEHTVPELVRQITRMNDLLERALDRLDDARRDDAEAADDDTEEPA